MNSDLGKSKRSGKTPTDPTNDSAAREQARVWIESHVTDAYDQARRLATVLAEQVDRDFEAVRMGHNAAITAAPDLHREAFDRLREMRSALRRFQKALDQQPLARLEQGRRRRAAEDGRGSGPLPLGYRYGPLDEVRTEKGARGARWVIELEPRGAKIVRRVFELQALHADPAEIAMRLYQDGLGFPLKKVQQALLDQLRAAQRATRQDEMEELQREFERLPSEQYLGRFQVEQVLRHEDLYRTGRRVWNGIEAQVRWPILLPD